jgi:hypothetical protein
MATNWAAIAFKIPALIQGGVAMVQHIKGAKGADKKQAVIDSLPGGIGLIELGAGKDVLNDTAIMQLVSALVDAEAAALKARDALRQGLLAKGPAAEPS